MAVTVDERPQGYVIDYDVFGYAVASNSSGDVLFTDNGHGRVDGDIIYMVTPVQSYNGFWKVDEINGNDFKIKDIATDAYTPFVKVTEDVCQYYVTLFSHSWSCVHLPIAYKISNNLFPTNNINTLFSLSAYGFINGYFAVTHSALTGINILFAGDYVKLNNGERVVKVIQAYSTTITVLDDVTGAGSFVNMIKQY